MIILTYYQMSFVSLKAKNGMKPDAFERFHFETTLLRLQATTKYDIRSIAGGDDTTERQFRPCVHQT